MRRKSVSSTQWLATALAATWITAGFVAAVVMRRSGYDLKLWLGLGVLLGPFAVVVATDQVFASETDTELMVLGARGHGMSEAVLGSVSSPLIGSSRVPVFVGRARPRSDGRGND